MNNNPFFDEQTEQSRIKSQIVAKYFWAWAKVIIPWVKKRNGRIGFIDLFSGPGIYADGSKSTPILVLERAIADTDMRQMLVTVFNDKDAGNIESLKVAIAGLAGVNSLKHPPTFRSEEVGPKVSEIFEQLNSIPSLFFLDPWGYKGMSLKLIGSAIKDWGSECILFFNYLRINLALDNPIFQEHMDALFGETRAEQMRQQLQPLSPEQRELTIIEAISRALKEAGGQYVLPFRFKGETGVRTSHHLIFVTKNVKGYEIMKEIMAKEGSIEGQGVPSFEYNPASSTEPLLFELSRPLDELGDMLLIEFAGRTMTMQAIYYGHHIGKRYVKSNYKHALAKLESEGRLSADPPASKRRARKGQPTFGDDVEVTFLLLAGNEK